MFENEARMEGVQGRFPYDDLHLHDTCAHAAVSFYRPQRSCGKVMFLHLSVILFTGAGVSVQGGLCQGDPPPPYGYVRVLRILVEWAMFLSN